MKKSNSVLILITVFILASLVYPTCIVLKSSFLWNDSWSFHSFYLIFSNPILLESIFESIKIASYCTVICWIFAVPLAFFSSKYVIPKWAEFMVITPLFLPPFAGVVGLRAFLGKQGVITFFFKSIGLLSERQDALLSFQVIGIAFVQAIHMYPVVYFSVSSVLKQIPQSLLEASSITGANTLRQLYSIEYSMIKGPLYSSLGLCFVGSLTDVGTPLLFEKRTVVATQIFNTFFDMPKEGVGYSLCVMLIILSMFVFYFTKIVEDVYPSRLSERTLSDKKIISSKNYIAVTFFILVGLVSLIPHFSVIILTFGSNWFLTLLPHTFTFENLKTAIAHRLVVHSFVYSILLGFIASIVCFLIAGYIAWCSIRIKSRLSIFLEFLCMTPAAIPGVCLAFGMVIGFSGTFLDNRLNPSYLLIMAYSVRKLPFMVKVIKSSLLQIPVGIEEAAIICGVPQSKIFLKILIPIIKNIIYSGLLVCFMGSLLEVSDSLMLPLEECYYPISKALYTLQSRPDGYPIAAAYSFLIMLLLGVMVVISNSFQNKKKVDI